MPPGSSLLDETRDRILEAALDLFSVKGYAAARTREIAERAGVNEVTLFRLFGSKRELYIAVYRRFAMVASEESILSGVTGDPRSDVFSIARAIAALFSGNTKIVHMSIKDIDAFPEINAELKAQPEVLVSLVSAYFSRIAPIADWSDDPARLARVFVISLMGTVLHLTHFKGDRFVADFVEDLTAVLWRGMRDQVPCK